MTVEPKSFTVLSGLLSSHGFLDKLHLRSYPDKDVTFPLDESKELQWFC